MDAFDQKVIDSIEEFGCHVTQVFDPEGKEPDFSYSIGLFKNYNAPEILIIGLKFDLCQDLINNICEDYKEGKYLKVDDFNSDILDNFDCFVVEVDKKYYNEYFGQSIWYYKNTDFPVLQIVYPTTSGVFPWDKKFPKRLKQPILKK